MSQRRGCQGIDFRRHVDRGDGENGRRPCGRRARIVARPRSGCSNRTRRRIYRTQARIVIEDERSTAVAALDATDPVYWLTAWMDGRRLVLQLAIVLLAAVLALGASRSSLVALMCAGRVCCCRRPGPGARERSLVAPTGKRVARVAQRTRSWPSCRCWVMATVRARCSEWTKHRQPEWQTGWRSGVTPYP